LTRVSLCKHTLDGVVAAFEHVVVKYYLLRSMVLNVVIHSSVKSQSINNNKILGSEL